MGFEPRASSNRRQEVRSLSGHSSPQGRKPTLFWGSYGTTEVVPFPFVSAPDLLLFGPKVLHRSFASLRMTTDDFCFGGDGRFEN
jgi:hypothetical protein